MANTFGVNRKTAEKVFEHHLHKLALSIKFGNTGGIEDFCNRIKNIAKYLNHTEFTVDGKKK